MSIQRLVSVLAIIASCHASGIGHLAPVAQPFPIVRYAPFFSFPNAGRSIHAIAPAPAPVFQAPAPVFPAPAPLFSAPPPVPAFRAPVLPAPAPAFPAPAFPAPAFPGPVFHAAPEAPAPFPVPAPAPVHFVPQPFFTPALPRLAPLVPSLPRLAPAVTYPPAPVFARTLPALHAVPFSPIIRPAVAPALPAPVFAPAPVAVAKALPFGFPAYAPHLHAPLAKQVAWK